MASKHSVTAAATPDGASAVDQPAEKAADPKPKAPAKRTRTAKAASTKAMKPSRKASPKASPKAPAEASQGGLGSLLDKAEADALGTVQVAVRLSPRTRKRLRASMTRAGLVQEKFIAFLIDQGLDELDKTLAAREADEK